MKKRILSLLLLLAMLVTMIPVATVAAEEKAQTQENGATGTDHDYHDLYITDGLVGLFTAMDKDDDTVNPTNDGNGAWVNRVSGKTNAALGGLYWRRTENGGIGYDLYRGAADDANGTHYVDVPTVNGAETNTYGRTSFLQFGNSMLPHEDFTVEYVAEYLPIYTRLTGEDAVIGSKVVGDAYTFNAPA